MALTETEKRPDKKEKPLTKVVIRRLPPTMTQDQFINQVSPVPDYNYIYYVKGDTSLGENAFARAYINFICPEDVYSFKERFDNYVFVDGKGHEYSAVVEFAPFQKIPKKRGKNRMDPKCNTIESDSYYIDFMANLNKPVEQEEKPEYSLQLNEKNEEKKDTTTPLLEYIKNKRAQRQKIREVRREERERRKKEYERKKEYKYYDDKKFEERSPSKVNRFSQSKSKIDSTEKIKSDSLDDKSEKSFGLKGKEKRYEEKRERKEIKPRFPKKEYIDNREYKREDYTHREYRSKHYDDYKKEDSKIFPKKVKKYSERREERKMEAQKKLEQREAESKPPEDPLDSASTSTKQTDDQEEKKQMSSESQPEKEPDKEDKSKETEKNEGNSSKRIRNKDRPTIPLYRPGMLSKRKQGDEIECRKD